MNILLLNWQDPENPLAGGAEIHLREIFSRIHRSGHHVTWVASGWRGSAPRSEQDGIPVHRTGTRYTFGAIAPRHVRRHVRPERFDVVVEALNKVPLYTPLWTDRPVVLLVHHLFGTTAFREASLPIASLTWLQERPVARVYRDVRIQAISESTARDLAQRGLDPHRIQVIHPGVDLDFFSPPISPSRASEPTFLYLGRLRKYKRVDLAVRAFARLLPRFPRARLVIAGKGDAESALRRLAERLGATERVEFAGFVSEERKRELFRSAWANVFVSPKEGWGITNLEAAACATPTIASDSPGLRESVRHGETGLLVPHGDMSALENAMARLAGDPALVERLGSAAAEHARSFSWERAATATEHHLLESVAGRGA